ncbi:unnamed protein product [Eruca vesicaria subsp. sativa]|uniref:F-box domain-containing protein n=1 Tax=Eruca vesicaria subsp. sativa TaxID=29727 RepID=A0ABC8M5I7_ERUVS|nr:unnamed protein product [Eruca vesicaria subsp. sativa]
MDQICNELLELIFLRSSPNTLKNLRVVCKQWGSIIDDPIFIKNYERRPINRPRLLLGFWAHDNRYEKRDLWSGAREDRQLHFCASTPMFLHPSNTAFFSPRGLHAPLEFASRQPRDVQVSYYCVEGLISHGSKIQNPSLGWSVDIPRIDSEYGRVLGFDPINEQYKLLALRRVGIGSNGGGYQVLTVGEASDKWRIIESESTPEFPMTNSICIDGFVYYITLSYSTQTCSLVRFDVSKEKVDIFKMKDGPSADLVRDWDYPPSPNRFLVAPLLLDLKGKLSVVINNRMFCVWVLEDPTIQSWSEFTFSLPRGLYYHARTANVGASCVDKNTGEIILIAEGHGWYKHMVFVNLETNAVRSTRIMDEFSLDNESFAIRDYKECLFGWRGRLN